MIWHNLETVLINTGGIPNEPSSYRKLHCAEAQGKESHTGAVSGTYRRVQQDDLQMGKGQVYARLQHPSKALRRTQELEHQKEILCGVLLVVLGIACNAMSGMISGSEIQELISGLLAALSVAEISAEIFERNTDLHTVFGANLMWYLQFHVVCARLPLFVGIP